MPQIRRADLVGRCIGRSKQLPAVLGQHSRDILEHVTLSQDIPACSNLKGVAGKVVPVVVYLVVLIPETYINAGWGQPTAWRRVLD